MAIANPEAVLAFWFGDDVAALEAPQALEPRVGVWFASNADFDARIRERFADLPGRARAGELDAWRDEARATLALVLILDQFPRNLYRAQADSFAFDPLAYEVAVGAIARGIDAQLSPIEAMFLYLPLEHAEDVDAQNLCVTLIDGLIGRCAAAQQPQFESCPSNAVRHRDVIERFGRFPHRNALLGRTATDEEVAYLEAGGDTF
jgi:uncharacterized protein (DUF924 family)